MLGFHHFSTSEHADYRFGFNGKEKDDEVSGNGNQYDYGFRIYNPRIGKFLSVDPLSPDYPELSTYQFASNTPIWAIDIDGLEAGYTASYNVYVDKNGDYVTEPMHEPVLTTTNGDWSGTRTESQFFFNGNFMGNSQSNIPGWDSWRTRKQEEFNQTAGDVLLLTGATVTTVASFGTASPLWAGIGITTGTFGMGTGTTKLILDSQGYHEESAAIPATPGGGFGMAGFALFGGDYRKGQALGDFTNSAILLGGTNLSTPLGITDFSLTLTGTVTSGFQLLDTPSTTTNEEYQVGPLKEDGTF